VSGPTGSGKSTTLYAILGEINDATRKIITVEDPIEYRMPGVTQVAVNNRVGLSFAAGLRTILRSDPDIVMVGEVRDPETAEISVRAALTGHLMLSSIHTNDAPSALTRLNDMKVPPYITSSALIGAVSQRLVRVLCPHCKQAAELSPDQLINAGFTEDEIDVIEVFEAVGCVECNNTGYRGRTGVFEIMEFEESLSGLLLHDAPVEEMRRAAVDKGMKPMRRDALDKVAAGLTSIEEIDRVVIQL
jgi:type IV pilus assembly protein PilB